MHRRAALYVLYFDAVSKAATRGLVAVGSLAGRDSSQSLPWEPLMTLELAHVSKPSDANFAHHLRTPVDGADCLATNDLSRFRLVCA